MKRRIAKTPAFGRVTREAVRAFVAKDWMTLHMLLGLAPWNTSPLDVDRGPAPKWHDSVEWAAAQVLRAALERKLREGARRPG